MTPNTKQRDLLKDGFTESDCESEMDVLQGADLFRYISLDRANELLKAAIEKAPRVWGWETHPEANGRMIHGVFGFVHHDEDTHTALLVCVQPIGGGESA